MFAAPVVAVAQAVASAKDRRRDRLPKHDQDGAGRLAFRGEIAHRLPRPVRPRVEPAVNNHLIEPQSTHVTDRSLELLAPLDIRPRPVEFKCRSMRRRRQRSTAIFTNSGSDRGFALINPGATWDSKLWVMERFGQVAKYLGKSTALPSLVVWAGERELRLGAGNCGAFRRPCESGAADFAARTSWRSARRRESSSAPIRDRCTWPWRRERPVSGCTAPRAPKIAALMVRRTSPCRCSIRRAAGRIAEPPTTRAMQLIQVDRVCDACDDLVARPQTGAMRGLKIFHISLSLRPFPFAHGNTNVADRSGRLPPHAAGARTF